MAAAVFDVSWQEIIEHYGARRAMVILRAFEKYWGVLSRDGARPEERWAVVMRVAREQLTEWERGNP